MECFMITALLQIAMIMSLVTIIVPLELKKPLFSQFAFSHNVARQAFYIYKSLVKLDTPDKRTWTCPQRVLKSLLMR